MSCLTFKGRELWINLQCLSLEEQYGHWNWQQIIIFELFRWKQTKIQTKYSLWWFLGPPFRCEIED